MGATASVFRRVRQFWRRLRINSCSTCSTVAFGTWQSARDKGWRRYAIWPGGMGSVLCPRCNKENGP